MAESGTPAPTERTSALPLAVLGVGLGLCLVAFNLLYLSVPWGWTPRYGFAPDIANAFRPVWFAPQFTFNPTTFKVLSLLLWVGMWGTYLAAFALCARPAADEPRTRRILVSVAGITSVALVLTPPVLSQDLYHYAAFGKMLLTRGLNPYTTTINALADDPLWALANWRDLPTHYGPAFTLLSALAVLVGGGAPVGTALAFKAMTTGFGALAVWAIHRLVQQEKRNTLQALLLVAWNPLILVETAGNGHNEMVMLGLGLAGLVLARGGRTNLGIVLMVCSVHTKWITAVLLGLWALEHLREAPHRSKELARIAGIATVVTTVLYAPFWTGTTVIGSTRSLLTGGTSVSARMSGASVGWTDVLCFAAAVAMAAVLAWRSRPSRLPELASAVSLAFVMFVFPWRFPWYLIPALTFASAAHPDKPGRLLWATLAGLSLAMMALWAFVIPGVSG